MLSLWIHTLLPPELEGLYVVYLKYLSHKGRVTSTPEPPGNALGCHFVTAINIIINCSCQT